MIVVRLFFVLLLTVTVLTSTAAAAKSQEILGWVEWVHVLDAQFRVKAKLDTGAATSSLDATQIEPFKRKGKSWVRFTVTDPATQETIVLEKRRKRVVRIVRHNGKHQKRYVVELDVCLGQEKQSIEVSLIDRSQFIYPLLLGRSALEVMNVVVDPSDTFVMRPACEADASA